VYRPNLILVYHELKKPFTKIVLGLLVKSPLDSQFSGAEDFMRAFRGQIPQDRILCFFIDLQLLLRSVLVRHGRGVRASGW
jgi:hypothetical protein